MSMENFPKINVESGDKRNDFEYTKELISSYRGQTGGPIGLKTLICNFIETHDNKDERHVLEGLYDAKMMECWRNTIKNWMNRIENLKEFRVGNIEHINKAKADFK